LFLEQAFVVDPVFEALHPDVARWCEERFVTPTLPQRESLARGLARDNLLIS